MSDERTIIEIDQWTQTGNVDQFSFDELRELIEADDWRDAIEGGDSEAAQAIFGGRVDVKTVSPNADPRKGMVWFTEADDGGLEEYKANYATQ